MNRIGLGLLGALLLGGVVALFLALGDGGEGDGDTARGALRPGAAPDAGMRDDPRPDDLSSGPAIEPAAGIGLGVAPEGDQRTAATVQAPEGLATNTRQLLSGRVMASGRPAEGAQVLYQTKDGQALGEDTTDAGGAFSLQAPFPIEDGMILVRARGYTPLLTGPHAIRASERRFVGNLTLTPGLMLGGRVTDQSGAGLGGARIEVRVGAAGGGYNQHVVRATSDNEGMFRVPEAPMGQLSVSAHADGFGSQVKEMLHQSAEDRVTLSLAHERSLIVRVVDGRDRPVEGAEVFLRPHAPSSPRARATTDAYGNAQVAGLGSELWEIRVDAKGYRTGVRDRVVAEGVAKIELVAWPCIRGKVVVPEGGAPPEGTVVKALTADARGAFVETGQMRGTPVADDGTFEICDMRPGLYSVQAHAPGWAPTRSSPIRLTLGGDAEDVRVQLAAGAKVDILVHGGGGPVAGATVELWSRVPPPTELWRTEATPQTGLIGALFARTTDAQGHARLENVSEEQYWALIKKDGLLPTTHGPITVPSKGEVRVGPIRLEEGGRLSGTLTGVPPGAGETTVNLFGENGVTQNAPVIVVAGKDGTWNSPLLPPGRYRITARVIAGSPPRAHTAGAQEHVVRGENTEVQLELR